MDKTQQGNGIPASALGRRVAELKSAAAAPQALSSGTKLSKAMLTIERGEHTELPLLGRVYIRLLPHLVHNEVEARTLAEIGRAGLPIGDGFGATSQIERQVQILAESVMDPDDTTKPFGGLSEWRNLDDDLIISAFLVYQDCRNRLDPITALMTDERFEEIRAAIEKKNLNLLLHFGVRELSIWLLTGGLRPGSSPTAASSSSPSSIQGDGREQKAEHPPK